MKKLLEKIKQSFAPTHTYCVMFLSPHPTPIGVAASHISMVQSAKSPDLAVEKVKYWLEYYGINVVGLTYIKVEQIR